jgi:hypothetical protein
MIPELTIRYNHVLRPESAECSSCGQQMPKPPSELTDSSDLVLWFSGQVIDHRKEKHPAPPYGSEPVRDIMGR